MESRELLNLQFFTHASWRECIKQQSYLEARKWKWACYYYFLYWKTTATARQTVRVSTLA